MSAVFWGATLITGWRSFYSKRKTVILCLSETLPSYKFCSAYFLQGTDSFSGPFFELLLVIL